MTAQPDIDIVRHLDWHTYRCQCPQHASGCDNRAVYAVALHALHACNQPGLDPFGNRIELRCGPCVAQLWAEIQHKIVELNRYGRAQCETCGAPIADASDVLRSVEVIA